MSEAMTQLERELLGYVERLVASCEVSAKELHSLEQRSTPHQSEVLTGLRDCIALLALAGGADTVVQLRSERVRDLRTAGSEIEHECAAADQRRSEIESTLTERARVHARDHGDDYGL